MKNVKFVMVDIKSFKIQYKFCYRKGERGVDYKFLGLPNIWTTPNYSSKNHLYVDFQRFYHSSYKVLAICQFLKRKNP